MKQSVAVALYPGKSKIYPSFYTKGEEIFNAVSHIVGGAIGLVVFIVTFIYAYPSPVKTAAVSVFSASIVILYTMSALYHFLPNGAGKAVFRIFDHCTIFLLIAGTYTPYCLIALGGTAEGVAILATEWFLAVLGIVGNAIAMNNKVIKGLSMAAYFVMGWLILAAIPRLMNYLSAASLALLVLGGVAYTGGIVFFAFGKKVRYFHSIWHLFDILGTVLHSVSILLMVLI